MRVRSQPSLVRTEQERQLPCKFILEESNPGQCSFALSYFFNLSFSLCCLLQLDALRFFFPHREMLPLGNGKIFGIRSNPGKETMHGTSKGKSRERDKILSLKINFLLMNSQQVKREKDLLAERAENLKPTPVHLFLLSPSNSFLNHSCNSICMQRAVRHRLSLGKKKWLPICKNHVHIKMCLQFQNTSISGSWTLRMFPFFYTYLYLENRINC